MICESKRNFEIDFNYSSAVDIITITDNYFFTDNVDKSTEDKSSRFLALDRVCSGSVGFTTTGTSSDRPDLQGFFLQSSECGLQPVGQ